MNNVVEGTVEPGFEEVREAFADAFAGKPTMGAALAIRHQGRLVVDLWGGVADERSRSPWLTDTPSVIFSCTKGLVSILAARLVQEGRLDYQEPVATYWPEFAAAGKENVRVTDLLAHRSGLSAPREPLADIADWDAVVSQLAAQEPLWEPGTGYAYHAITHGWLAGEVIRRITGVSVGEYFASLITRPLQADAWIGLPPELHSRVAHMQVGSTLAQLIAQHASARVPGVTDWGERAMTLGGALAPALVGPGEADGFNDPRIQSAQVPGAGGIATARALATIWSATVVSTDGVRLLDDAVMAEATAPQSEGPPVWDVPGPWPRWGMGFQLDSEARRFLSAHSFGHDGAGGQSAFADPGSRVGFAFLTNQMEAIDDTRATAIIDALRRCLGLGLGPGLGLGLG